ncbi:MAG: TIGR03000 domain-containing protein [Gemmataceae bacterium]
MLCLRTLSAGIAALLVLTAGAFGRPQDDEKATLRVYVPVADARLEIQGKVTTRTGTTRLFESPPLAAGKAFLYDLKATWAEGDKTVVREKTVRVMAGQTTEVDMAVPDKPPEVKPADAAPPANPPKTETPKPPADPVPPVKPIETPKPMVELRKPDVDFVVTPEAVVDEMLKLAKVKVGDVVYDLGCGDGRIVIAAVKRFGAKKGVGIDIDPARIKESQENAKKQGIESKVEFKLGDILALTEKDLADATVVTMFLSPKVNNKLTPMLKKLKPGTRIVSHDFGITEWPEDEKKDITVDFDRTLYLWVVK